MAKRRVRPVRPRRPAIVRETAPASGRIRYVESSALVAALLEHDSSVISALRGQGHYVTSALTFAESARAIVRARATHRLTSAQEVDALRALAVFERRWFVIGVSSGVLARAGRPFPAEPVRTLDAVHLATIELLGEPPELVTVVTRDARVRNNARALGCAVA